MLDVSYGAYVVKGAYSGNSSPTGAPKHNDAVATVRELLNGNIADVRLSAREANTAISIIQTFANAADGIAAKLAKMEELAKKASSPDYSRVEIEAMQKEFKILAKEINETVKSTEYDFNKIFTSAGESISIPIGDGSSVDIFARDFSFNSQGLDLTTDPKSALSNIKKAITNLNEYKQYLNRQVSRVEDATAIIESELESAMGIELDDFTPEVAIETAVHIASQLSQDSSTAFGTQANVTADEALQLLKGRS
ncbi:MAG: flagellin [Phycisphaerae bacterium]